MMNENDPGSSAVAGTRVPPPVSLMAVILAGFALQRYFPLPLPFPKALAMAAGSILLAAGVAAGALAARSLFAGGSHPSPHRPTRRLVTSGIYARTRNPIYVSMAVLVLGLAVLARNGWHLIGLVLFMLVIDRAQIPREERYLEGRFGEEFRDYKRRVRRWV